MVLTCCLEIRNWDLQMALLRGLAMHGQPMHFFYRGIFIGPAVAGRRLQESPRHPGQVLWKKYQVCWCRNIFHLFPACVVSLWVRDVG